MICLCYVQLDGDPGRLQYLLRRIRHHLPGTPVLVGLWPGDLGAGPDDRLRAATGADYLCETLTGSVNACLDAARNISPEREPELLPS